MLEGFTLLHTNMQVQLKFTVSWKHEVNVIVSIRKFSKGKYDDGNAKGDVFFFFQCFVLFSIDCCFDCSYSDCIVNGSKNHAIRRNVILFVASSH